MVRAIKVVPLAEDGYSAAPGAPAPRSFGAGSARRGSGGGSGAMGKVPSLLFDLEDLGEGSQNAPARDAADEASADDVVAKLYALLEPWSEPGKLGSRSMHIVWLERSKHQLLQILSHGMDRAARQLCCLSSCCRARAARS